MTRTIDERAEDAILMFRKLRDEVTPPIAREILGRMTDPAVIGEVGDVQAYAALVQASVSLRRIISEADAAVMHSAVIATQSGIRNDDRAE